ncbi:PIG-L deacetylase family protein [Acidobacteriota bacterium]
MKKILVISPHMDDEVIGLGGVICKYIKEGYHLKVCFVCNRAYEHKYKEELIEEEKNNALKAKGILRYQEHTFLDLYDEKTDEKLINVIIPIENIVQSYKPNIVFIPHKGDINQDHRSVFDASMVALRSYSSPFVEAIYSYEVPSSTEQSASFVEYTFLPNFYVNIKEYIETKKEALSCYQKEKREFPHPRSIKAIEILAQMRGIAVNFEYAEAFEVIKVKNK